MKQFIRESLVSLLVVIGLISFLPFISFGQEKILKLNLDEELYSRFFKESGQKKVSKIDIYQENVKVYTMQFGYDSKGRVHTLKCLGEYGQFDNLMAVYEIKEDVLILGGYVLDPLTGEQISPYIEAFTCELNDQGYILTQKATGPYTRPKEYHFTYDELGQTSTFSWCDETTGEETDTFGFFDWVDGNILTGNPEVGAYNKTKWREYYTYTSIVNKANINLNKLFTQTYNEDMSYFSLCGYIGNKDKNLLESVSESEKLSYVFDEDGYPIEIVKSRGAYSGRYVITYDEDSPTDPIPGGDPTTDEELEDVIENAPEGTEDNPTEIFIPSDGITLNKPIDIDKHIRFKGGSIVRGDGNPYALLRVREGYSLDLDGITIDGRDKDQKDGALVVYGKLRLREGTILKNCYRSEINTPSGVICVGDKGYVRMDDGVKIMDNIGSYGSAVYCEGMFEMYGGEISGNKTQIGTIVMNVGGVFKMHGGKIVRNGTSEGCGGVFIGEDSQCWIYSGEISGNEDCDIYSWSDIFSGSNANVEGAVWLTGGNKLQIIDRLKYNWNIAFVNDPIPGTIVASGYMGFSLNNIDLQHVHYLNNAYSLLLKGNDILISKEATSTEKIVSENSQIRILDQTVYIENFSSNTRFIVYSMDGKLCLSGQTDTNGRASFFLPKGFYLLKDEKMTYKFFVR